MRISIALKIYGIALGLLVLLGVAAAFSTINIGRVNSEVRAIGTYFTPLAHMASRVQIKQLQQSLLLERTLRVRPTLSRADARVIESIGELTRLGAEIDAALAAADKLAAEGLAFAASEADRVEFSRLQPTFKIIEKEHQDYEDRARAVFAALDRGEAERAVVLQEVLAQEERDLLAQLDAFRDTLQTFSRRSIEEAAQHDARVFRVNLLIALAAAVSGLLFASLVTTGLMRPIRSLVLGTRAIEEGKLDTEVPITSTDEIGALTRSFNNMVGELRIKERIKDTFGKYVDPRIVADLLQRPDLTSGSGERRMVTIFFSDIEGFTSIGENLTPGTLVAVINRYFTVMSEPVTKNGGIIDKYIGDGIMAFWTPPFVGSEQHATGACLAAIEQLEALVGFQQMLPELIGVRKAVPAIRIRIGIATGEVVVGSIGSDTIRGYTVIGDAVNLGARLEGAAKQYGVRILISDKTYEMAAAVVEVRELDFIRVTGKTEPVRVFEVLGRRGELTTDRSTLRDQFQEGLAYYRAGQWDSAERLFQQCLTIDPSDTASRLFVERVAHFRREPPAAPWDGVWTLSHK